MQNKSILLFFSLFLILTSCKDRGPQPDDMVGLYVVSAQLTDGVFDKEDIKSSITDAFKEAKNDIAKAKDEIKTEFDLLTIDTSTVEGKIEYAAKKFSKSMAELGTSMGEIGTELGGLISGLTTSGFDLGENLLKNMKLDVELQSDGDIKVNNPWVNIGLKNAKWEVKGNQFILIRDNNETPDVFEIKDRNANGFTLSKDEIEIQFVKK